MSIHGVLMVGALALTCAMATAQTRQRGVTHDEILVGSIQDLSGPVAGYGKQARNGMLLRVEEANEQGGLYGRRLRMLVEDSAYDPRKAVLAAQKLVNQDGIFAMIGHLGTAHNNAAMPVLFEKNVINFMPLTASRDMYEPPHRLKFALFASYHDQMRLTVPRMVKERNIDRVCAIHQDDDFGQEVLHGTEAGLKVIGKDLVEKTSFKRGTTEFSSQVAKMKAAHCDMVVMGTIIRETVGVIAESRKSGFSPLFLASAAAYSDLIHKLGGKPMDGLFAAMSSQHPYTDEQDVGIRFWANKYKTRFNEEPTVMSVYGYTMVDMFVRAARKTGPSLTTDSFIKSMDFISFTPDSFGSPRMTYGPTKRLGTNATRLSQIVDGRWKVVSEYIGESSGAAVVGKAIDKAEGRR